MELYRRKLAQDMDYLNNLVVDSQIRAPAALPDQEVVHVHHISVDRLVYRQQSAGSCQCYVDEDMRYVRVRKHELVRKQE